MITSNKLALALRQAYYLGQTYWQQADSEYTSQWEKSKRNTTKVYGSCC